MAADRELWERCERAGNVPGWLAEHVENGFPESSELRSLLEPHGRVELIANENVGSHRRMMRVELTRLGAQASRGATPLLRPFLRDGARGRRVASSLTRRLLRGGDRPPAYRTALSRESRSPCAAESRGSSLLDGVCAGCGGGGCPAGGGGTGVAALGAGGGGGTRWVSPECTVDAGRTGGSPAAGK